jgi:hypothetical protein
MPAGSTYHLIGLELSISVLDVALGGEPTGSCRGWHGDGRQTPLAGRRLDGRRFGNVINRLIAGENITRAEARQCWRQICEEEQPDLQQGAFIAALKAKKETPEEVAGTFEAVYEFDTIKVKIETPEPF